MEKVKIGIVGCGNISSIYMKNCSEVFDILEVAACADLVPEKAKEKAEEFGIPKACTLDEMLQDQDIKIILNLTIPKVHAEVSIKALNAGKHVYSEKPLAVTREDGKRILETAQAKGLLVGCAPDTFLGGGLQTCRKLIDDGWIGEPIGATAFMMGSGPESWHPNPQFFYQVGGGPMFDMGPYYLTALISLLGPVNDIAGAANISYPERAVTSQPYRGTSVKVEVPTHIAALLNFESGALASLITTFDVWGGSKLPNIEIYGSEGTLIGPDPNFFGGPILVRRKGSSDWREVPLTHGYDENSRGIGLADMAHAILSGREHRANGKLAYHVLDIMHGIHDSSDKKANHFLESTCTRPAALPLGLAPGALDK